MNYVKDSVFNQNFCFASDVINIKKYFTEYAGLFDLVEKCQEEKCKTPEEDLGCETDSCKDDEFYMNNLGVTKEQLKEIKQRTSLAHLTCDGEITPVSHDFYKKFDEEKIKQASEEAAKTQKSLISVKKRLECSDVNKDDFPKILFKYQNYLWNATTDVQIKKNLEFKSDDYSTIVACVKVYHPFISDKTKCLRMKLLQEIHILGNQTLAELRDSILCCLDYVGEVDVSSDFFLRDVGFHIPAKEKYPSSFLFIENTFYNDTRDFNSKDLSKNLKEWALDKGLGRFGSATMKETKICDLELRIGYPYVFQHQGNCEHLVVFSDVRFLELQDFKSVFYPRTHCTGRIYGRHCMMCGESYARWLVVGSDRLTHDKAYLCTKCFASYNYINKQKIGKFKAYKYIDTVALLS